MCPRRKVKNASSVLRHFALSWWQSLDPLDKPHSWDDMKLLMRVTFVNAPPSLNSYDEVNHLEEEFVVISLAMPNFLQDNVHKQEDDMEDHEELTTSCVNSEPSHYNAPVTPTENNDIGNTHGATLTEGESSLNVPKFSTNHGMIEQILVEPSLDLPLSQHNLLDIPCDKDDLHDHEHESTEPPTCAELKHVNHIDSGMNELKNIIFFKNFGLH